MLIENRLESLLLAIKKQGSLSYEEAMEMTGCSKDTIRRDFIKLGNRNLAIRTRGGILFKESSIFSYDKGIIEPNGNIDLYPDINNPAIKNFEQKKRIGKLAARKVKGNQTVMLDSGSTSLLMTKQLEKQQDLTLITNCIRISNELLHRPDIHSILLGGDLNIETWSILGPDALHMIKHYHVDMLFLGAAAVSIEKGLMSPYSIEAMLKKEMIASAEKVILLADSSKIQKFALYSFAGITDISTLITDENISPRIRDELENLGIEVEIAADEE